MLTFNLQLSRCCGQCYDGGSNMAGCESGAKTQILKQELRAFFTHCYGHLLSLSVADTIRTVKYLGSIMDTIYELSKLLQYSPKHLALFLRISKQRFPLTVLDSVSFAQPDGLCAVKHFKASWIITVPHCNRRRQFWMTSLILK